MDGLTVRAKGLLEKQPLFGGASSHRSASINRQKPYRCGTGCASPCRSERMADPNPQPARYDTDRLARSMRVLDIAARRTAARGYASDSVDCAGGRARVDEAATGERSPGSRPSQRNRAHE